MRQYTHVAPHSLAGHKTCHVGKDKVGQAIKQSQVDGILTQPSVRCQLVLERDPVGGQTVVYWVNVRLSQDGRHEAQLFYDRIAHGQDVVTLDRRFEHGMLEIVRLIAKDIFEKQSLCTRPAQGIVEHSIVAKALFDDGTHRRNFVSKEDSVVKARVM